MACSKRIVTHKVQLTCSLCASKHHTKCAGLTPNDVLVLNTNDIAQHWTCKTCTESILPINLLTTSTTNSLTNNIHAASTTNKAPQQRENCHTCGKTGNISRLTECWICGNNSHQKCVSGELGCKKCLINIYPAYEISSYRYLYSIHSKNNMIFNPFDLNNDIHYIGEASEDDNNFEHAGWATCSNILNSCKYYEPREISASRANELKIFSLNIRS